MWWIYIKLHKYKSRLLSQSMIYSPKICFWNFYPAKAIGALGKLTLKNLRENYLFSVTPNTYHVVFGRTFSSCLAFDKCDRQWVGYTVRYVTKPSWLFFFFFFPPSVHIFSAQLENAVFMVWNCHILYPFFSLFFYMFLYRLTWHLFIRRLGVAGLY